MVHLVDRDHVWDLHDPGFQRLHGVARAGHEHEEDGVCDPDHLHLALARADRLQQDEVLAGRVEQERRLQGRLGEAAEMAARPHRADEDARVEEVIGEADSVAEERTLRERARGVDGDDADCRLGLAHVADERADQRRLAHAGRPGQPDHVGRPGARIELADELVRERVAILDERDRTRERAPVAAPDAVGERVGRPTLAAHAATASSRPRGARMTVRNAANR
jgi:hypothetical protein